jgi:DnaJ-domain-containing protein 1
MSTTLLTKVKRLQDQLQRREDRYPGERTSCRDIAKRLGQMVAAEEARMKREEWPRSKPLTEEDWRRLGVTDLVRLRDNEPHDAGNVPLSIKK